MSALPLVSIVTPSLNQGRFLRATIESVLAQTYPAIEYLVMDGGSTDESLEILRSYDDRLGWVSEPDRGQAQALNKGWRQARGEILGWINADDLLVPEAAARAVAALQADSTLAGVYGDCLYIDENDARLRAYPAKTFDYFELALQTEDYIPQPGAFVRRSCAQKIDWLDESLHYVMDYDFWLRLGLLAPLRYLPVEMARARLHVDAKTISSAPGFGRELALVFERLAQNPALPGSLRLQRRLMLSNAYIHSASYCFWGGETNSALIYLARAWRQTPFPRSRAFLRLLLFALAGRFGWRLAEKLHGNPFQLEHGR